MLFPYTASKASIMSNEVSKKEFLKRYLEKEESSRERKNKRKKKSKLAKPKANIPSLKIVNEDIDLKSMTFGEKADDDNEDEAPVVAEIIDDRPVEVKLKELYDSSRWKKINSFGKNKLDKTLSGLKAGLQNSKSLQEEVQKLRKREKSQLNMLDDEISGKNADTIIRDRKTGKKRDLDKEQENKDKEDYKNKEYLQKYEKWGKGTETRNEHLEKLQDEMYEMTKPLARYEDDADLDERLKSIIHDDDPMSAYMKKKKQKDTAAPNHPVFTGLPAPPNRYNVIPGYRWDSVDRSNGFEAKYFQKINQTKAVQDEAYLWSVRDM